MIEVKINYIRQLDFYHLLANLRNQLNNNNNIDLIHSTVQIQQPPLYRNFGHGSSGGNFFLTSQN